MCLSSWVGHYSKKGFDVKSYGTGSVIKLPGAGPNQPNVYQFGTSYDEILKDLTTKDQQLYPLSLQNLGFLLTSIRAFKGWSLALEQFWLRLVWSWQTELKNRKKKVCVQCFVLSFQSLWGDENLGLL